MDIGSLSMVMSQARVQQSAGIAVMKMAMDTGEENAVTMTDVIKNVAVDSNVGQHLDEREELKMEVEQELRWVKYRQNMLDIMDDKLLQMKEIVEQAKLGNLTSEELQALNDKLNNLAMQVKAIDEESRKMENRNILE